MKNKKFIPFLAIFGCYAYSQAVEAAQDPKDGKAGLASGQNSETSGVAAVIGGQEIGRLEVLEKMAAVKERATKEGKGNLLPKDDELYRSLLLTMAKAKIFSVAAAQSGVDKSPDFQKALKAAVEELMIQSYMKETESKIRASISPEELKKIMAGLKETLVVLKQMRFVGKDAPRRAERAVSALKKNGEEGVSKLPEKLQAMNPFPLSVLPEDMQKVMTSAKAGDAFVIPDEGGAIVLYVAKKEPLTQGPMLEQMALRAEMMKRFDALLNDLRKKLDVKIFDMEGKPVTLDEKMFSLS